MRSHHPSSAELAAFRRAIAGPRFEWETAPSVDEREHGVGFRADTDAAEWESYPDDRHEASAMRSRAYAQHFEHIDSTARDHCALPHPHPARAYGMEQSRGIPWQWSR